MSCCRKTIKPAPTDSDSFNIFDGSACRERMTPATGAAEYFGNKINPVTDADYNKPYLNLKYYDGSVKPINLDPADPNYETRIFNDVATMKATDDIDFDSLLQTKDYYNSQRGGGAKYLFKTFTQATADGDVYSPTSTGNIQCVNGVAVLNEALLTPPMFGCVGDNVALDSTGLQEMVSHAENKKLSYKFTKPDVAWRINETINFFPSDGTELGVSNAPNSIIGRDAKFGVDVVPAFVISPQGVNTLFQFFTIEDMLFIPNQDLGYSSGIIRINRCRQFEMNIVSLRAEGTDSAYLFQMDGSYNYQMNNCKAKGTNSYLFDAIQDIGTGEDDVCEHNVCVADFAAALGFVRGANRGRHNYQFNSCKAIASNSHSNKNAAAILTNPANAGDTSIIVSSTAEMEAGLSFLIGSGETSEIAVVDDSWVSGQTIPLRHPLRFNKPINDILDQGSFGVSLIGTVYGFDNCMFERVSAGIVSEGADVITVDNYLLTGKRLVYVRSGNSDGIYINKGRVGSIVDFGGVQYLVDYSNLAAVGTRQEFYAKPYVQSTAPNQNIIPTSGVGQGHMETFYQTPKILRCAASASVGDTSITVDSIVGWIKSGQKIEFNTGGVFTISHDQSPTIAGQTVTLTGLLSGFDIAANDRAKLGTAFYTKTRQYNSNRYISGVYEQSPTIETVMVDNQVTYKLDMNGDLLANQFNSDKLTDVDPQGGIDVVNGNTYSMYSGQQIGTNEVSLVWVKSLGNRVNMVYILTAEDARDNLTLTELMNTSEGTSALSVVGGEVVFTNGATSVDLKIRYGRTRLFAGR